MAVEAVYNDFSQGMNIRISPVELDKQRRTGDIILMIAQNYALDENGILAPRRGYIDAMENTLKNDANTAELPIRYIADYKLLDGTELVLVQSADAWYTADLTNKIYTKIQGGFTEDTEWSWDIFQDELYLCNGVDGLQKYNGNTETWSDFSGVANIPTDAKYVTSHWNHLFVASGDTLMHSPFDNLDGSVPWNGTEAWLLSGFILEPYTGAITGIKSDGDVLAVCTESRTEIFTGTNVTEFRGDAVDSIYGCTCHNSMQVVPYNGQDHFIWLSDRGVVVCDRQRVVSISLAIDPFFRNFNADRLTFAVGKYYVGNDVKRDWYMLSVSTQDSKQTFENNNITFCFNTRLKGWTYFNGMDVDSMAVMKGSDGISTCYFGTKNGNVFEFDSVDTPYTDNGLSIDQTLLLKHAWSADKNFISSKLRLKYRALSPTTLNIFCTPTMDNTTETFRQISLSAYQAGKVFNPIKNIMTETMNNYGYITKVISIYCFGRDVLIKMKVNEAGKNLAISEMVIEGHQRGGT